MPDPVTAAIVGGTMLVGGGMSGRESRKGAEKAANIQASAEQQGLEALRADLSPYNELGIESSKGLMNSVWGQQPFQQLTAQQLQSDPFFNALSREQGNALLQERAALGLGSSGGTMDAMNRNLLLLGNDFRQQHMQNALTQNQNRFNQLMGITQLGQASAARTGAQAYQSGVNIGQLNSVSPLARAQERSNMFGQIGNLVGMGAMAYGGGMFGGGGSPLGMGGTVSNMGSPVTNYTPGGGVSFDASRYLR